MSNFIASDFIDAVAQATAKEIARLAKTDPTKAADQFHFHVKTMTEAERTVFENWVVRYSMTV
jgi:hypothetical protein